MLLCLAARSPCCWFRRIVDALWNCGVEDGFNSDDPLEILGAEIQGR